MRNLNTGDLFKVLQIFKAAGLKDEFTSLINLAFTKKAKSEELGGRLFAILFDCLGHERTEPLLLRLLGSIAEKKPEEIAAQPIAETVQFLKDIAAQNDIAGFFRQAAPST